MGKSAGSRKSEIAAVIFYVAFIMEVLIMCVNRAGIAIPFCGRLLQFAALLFGIKILMTRYSLKEWIIIGVLGIAGFLIYFSARNTLIIEIVLMIAASKDMMKEKVLKCHFGIVFTAIILMIILSLTGVIGNLTLTRDYRRIGLETRYCFGYSHPNVFYSSLFTVMTVGILVFFARMRGIHYIILTGINIVFYFLADSRTGFLVVQLTIVLFYCLHRFPRIMEHAVVFWCGMVGLVGLIIASYSTLYLPYRIIGFMDQLLTGRIELAREWNYYNQWSLLPNNQTPANVLDMGYINVAANWGVLLGVIYFCAILCCYYKLYKVKNWPYVAALLVYSIFTFAESHAFSIYFVGNIMFLLM